MRLSLDARKPLRMSVSGGDRSVAIVVGVGRCLVPSDGPDRHAARGEQAGELGRPR